MQRKKKGEINQYADRGEPFHRRNTILGVATCTLTLQASNRNRNNLRLARVDPRRKSANNPLAFNIYVYMYV